MKAKAYRHHFGSPGTWHTRCIFCGLDELGWHDECGGLTRDEMKARPPCSELLTFPEAGWFPEDHCYLRASV